MRRTTIEEDEDERRLLLVNAAPADEAEFSEAEFMTPHGGLPPLDDHGDDGDGNGTSRNPRLSSGRPRSDAQQDSSSAEHKSRRFNKLRKLKDSLVGFIAVISYLFCVYVFVIVFVTAISFSINFLSQLIFTCFNTRNFSSTTYPIVIIALISFGIYAVTAFPIFIYDIFSLVADAIPRRAQYQKFGSRILFTNVPQKVLARWYSDEVSILKPSQEFHSRRHGLVRGFIILPAIIAAIPLAAVDGDVSLVPAWFLCISFLAAFTLAVLWIVTGYVKAIVEHCDFYRWIRAQWAALSLDDINAQNSTSRRWAIRVGLILLGCLTPLSFHWVIWKYQLKGKDLVNRTQAIEEEEALSTRYIERKKAGGCKRCFRSTKRIFWTASWLFLPLSVFITITMFSLISARAGLTALIFFFVTFPAVAIAFKHIWKGKASIWPLVVYIVLLLLTLVSFAFLLGTLTSQNQDAHIGPDNPALRALLKPNYVLSDSTDNYDAVTWANYQTDGIPHTPGTSARYKRRATSQGVMSYQMCKAQWNDLDIIDFGLFSWLAYFEINSTDFWQYANHWFKNSDWQLVYYSTDPVNFFDFYSPSRNLSVVGIRGTASVVDALEDLDLWSEALQLELVSMVFPFVLSWPNTATAGLVEAMSYLERIFVPTGVDFTYFSAVHNYVISIKPKRQVIMTGHSLGGSVAQVVGAKEYIPAITYCAPGIVYSRRKFGVSFDAIQQWTATIRTTSDLISAIDSPGGVVQDVRCDSATAFPDCHFLSHLLCPLLRDGCGHHTTDLPSPIVCD